jgi:hypothetical protein
MKGRIRNGPAFFFNGKGTPRPVEGVPKFHDHPLTKGDGLCVKGPESKGIHESIGCNSRRIHVRKSFFSFGPRIVRIHPGKRDEYDGAPKEKQ